MCFKTKSFKTEILIAKNDIICYKNVMLIPDDQKDNSELLLRPYYLYDSTRYTLGKIHKVKNSIFHRRKYINTSRVEGGAFHSKRTLSGYLNTRFDVSSSYNVIVRCTIPKGTAYIQNSFEYISEKIRLDFVIVTRKVQRRVKVMELLNKKCRILKYKD